MSTRAGVLSLLTLQRAVTALEDQHVPATWGDEATWPKPARHRLAPGQVGGDELPVDHLALVVGHEVAGHGARLREFGAEDIAYDIEAPPPYGRGGGSTSFSGVRSDRPRGRWAAVATAGIEAQQVAADALALRAAGGQWHYREAWTYLESRLDALGYVLGTPASAQPGHDVAAFLEALDTACAPGCEPIDRDILKRRALVLLADPLLPLAASAVVGSYVWAGDTQASLPMFRVGSVRYLPFMQFDLTPFGTEWASAHLLAREGRTALLRVRVGDAQGRTTWGAGVRAPDIARARGVPLGAAVDLWRQPRVEDDTSGALRTGAAAILTASIPLAGVRRVGVYLEAGAKTAGYIRGERLSAGPVLRVGATLRLP